MGSYDYPLLLIAGLLLGMWICERNSERPAEARRTFLVGAWGGVAGSLAWSVLFERGWSGFGLSSWGFFIGAAVASIAALRAQRGCWELGDFPNSAAPAAAAALSLARLGCHQAGCCFGRVTDVPWAVQFGPGSPALDFQAGAGWIPVQAQKSLPVHPTQLYEAAGTAVAFLVLQRLARKPALPPHSLMFGFGVAYGALRFLLGFLRQGPATPAEGLFTLEQAAALGATALSGLLLLASLRDRPLFAEASVDTRAP